jgi:hypothetical protein
MGFLKFSIPLPGGHQTGFGCGLGFGKQITNQFFKVL